MNQDAFLYSNHRRMQIRHTKEFLSSVVPKMDWAQMSEDVIMDIGCGPGDSTNLQLLPAVPMVKRIVAMDVLPSMIEYAKRNNSHPKIEYIIANIEDSATLQRWKGQMTKIFSIYCLHFTTLQKESFKNIYALLKPGGEAALLFVTKSLLWTPYGDVVSNPKWNRFLKNVEQHIPESNSMMDTDFYYKELFRKIGFDVISFETEQKSFTYKNDLECKNALASLCVLMNYIPDELKDEFKDDFFQVFLKFSPKCSGGKPTLSFNTLTVVLRKPKEF